MCFECWSTSTSETNHRPCQSPGINSKIPSEENTPKNCFLSNKENIPQMEDRNLSIENHSQANLAKESSVLFPGFKPLFSKTETEALNLQPPSKKIKTEATYEPPNPKAQTFFINIKHLSMVRCVKHSLRNCYKNIIECIEHVSTSIERIHKFGTRKNDIFEITKGPVSVTNLTFQCSICPYLIIPREMQASKMDFSLIAKHLEKEHNVKFSNNFVKPPEIKIKCKAKTTVR